MAKADVATPSLAYTQMAGRWQLPSALMGGTLAMRAAGTTYLPKMPKEDESAYRDRLNSSTLFNGYGRTVRLLAGRPFSRPVVVEEAPDELAQLVADVDLAGRDLTAFSRDLLTDMVTYGKAHILVDCPEQPNPDQPANLAQERQLKLRPYFVQVSPEALIGWQGQRVGGSEQLQQIRIRETTVEQEGEWGEKAVERVRVIYPDRFDLYRYDGKTWAQEKAGTPMTLGKVALVTIYGMRTGFLTSKPPLEDLAFLNLRHWQSQSDQDNILHVVRVPLLFFAGFSEKDLGVITIGPNRAIHHQKPDARVQFVEHTGAGIAAGRQDLLDLEARMAVMGADLLVRRPGNETATAKAIDTAESVSDLQAMVRNLEAGLEQAFGLAADWSDLRDTRVQVDINQDFGLSLGEAGDLDQLLKARLARQITQETYLKELKRRGVLGDQVDIEAEIAGVQTEGVL